MQVDDIGVFIGIDVGKSEHWATALDRDGRRIHDRALLPKIGRASCRERV